MFIGTQDSLREVDYVSLALFGLLLVHKKPPLVLLLVRFDAVYVLAVTFDRVADLTVNY